MRYSDTMDFYEVRISYLGVPPIPDDLTHAWLYSRTHLWSWEAGFFIDSQPFAALSPYLLSHPMSTISSLFQNLLYNYLQFCIP